MLDISSYGRAAHRTLTVSQRQQVVLTVRRVPEVLVKVSGGATSLGGVQAHLSYIGRDGELGVETDQDNGWRTRRSRRQSYLIGILTS